MSTLSFQRDITRFAEKTGVRGVTLQRNLAMQAFTGVMRKSPVKSGRFRGNWRVGINLVDLTENWAYKNKSAQGSVDPKGFGTGKNAILGAKWGDSIYITNNLIYGPKLESGTWSKQAPNGMLKITFAEVVAGLDRAVRALP